MITKLSLIKNACMNFNTVLGKYILESSIREEKILERKLRGIFSNENFPHQGSVRLSLILSAYPKIIIFFRGIVLHTTLR